MKIIVTGGPIKQRRFCQIISVFCMRHGGAPKYSERSFLEIDFCGPRQIRKLNARFRNKDRPTDVLSFPGTGDWIGSVVLCLEEIRARNPEVSLSRAVHKTLIHGVLHILGYDHDTDEAHEKMLAKEQEVYLATYKYLGPTS
jgi:rRNA maturation RNase YbeY